ncbi:MAG: response regulator [Acidobacteria bacterium]|nr:response regulator [Acidobacteriota bacterium]MBM3809559.1 response regulator [Acidimicrobiia bacterium]
MKQPSDYRILVVDDAPANIQTLSATLKERGYKISVAIHGKQALELMEKLPMDAVLLDVVMPELDGFGVLKSMKENAATQHIPVIMISAQDEMENVIRCIEMGAEDYLPKPFNPTLLHARIGACLEKKTLRDSEQEHLRTIEKTQRRLKKELVAATRYVRSILPAPTSSPLQIEWIYQPSTELGGDAFGYHWVDSDHFAVYLLDVSGHGVGAALLSVSAINVIRSGALPNTDFRDPGAVLAALNTAFPMEKQNNLYFTIWYGVYHAPSRTLRYASGAHPPALLLERSSSQSHQLRTQGTIIGLMEGMEYDTESRTVAVGDHLVVLCDGCFEIEDDQGHFMDFETFEEFMRQNGSAPDGLEQLQTWVRARHGDGPLDDDFSIVRIQF